ncbi:MAG: hypothetical protein ACRCZP_06170, partial [Phycicoccus sp.]
MGLGQLFTRNQTVTITDQLSGQSVVHEIVTGPGAYPSWDAKGPYRGGLGVPAAARCAGLMCDQLSVLPWHVYREGPAGVAERVPTPAVIERPSLIEQAVATWSSMALDLIWHGNAVAII